MNPIDLAAQALMVAEKGGRELEVRLRYVPEGRIVRGAALGQPPKQDPATFTAGIYEVGADEHVILATGGQVPEQVFGQLALMIIHRGTHWFAPGDRPGLEIVPDDGEEEKSAGDDNEDDGDRGDESPDEPEPHGGVPGEPEGDPASEEFAALRDE